MLSTVGQILELYELAKYMTSLRRSEDQGVVVFVNCSCFRPADNGYTLESNGERFIWIMVRKLCIKE